MKQTNFAVRWGAAVLVVMAGGASMSAGAAASTPAHSVSGARAERPAPARSVVFSGRRWTVKSIGPTGPGPNFFSESNVWVDARGHLHLKISRRGGHFECAEVVGTESLGCGTYRFYCETPANAVDTNAVLGMFTWKDEPSFAHREIDVEVSKWSRPDNQSAQFVVQPYTMPNHITRFDVPGNQSMLTYSFDWTPGRVAFQCVKGGSAAPAGSGSIVAEQTFTQDIPEPGGENPRINLWLFRGQPPANGTGCEVIIDRFEFIPAPH